MATRTAIVNITGSPIGLPAPYRGIIPPGRAAIVSDDAATVISNLGGQSFIESSLTVQVLDPASAVTVHDLEAGSNLAIQHQVRAASTANVSLTSAPSTLDGVTLATGDRLLLKNQTTASQNGVYVWSAASTALTRATDMDTSDKIAEGAIIEVPEGTVNASSLWAIRAFTAPFTLGTDDLNFDQFVTGVSYGAIGDMATTGVSDVGTAGVSTKVSRTDHVHPIAADVTMLKEVDHTIKTTASTTAATAGGFSALVGGAGSTSGAGGQAKLIGGAGGATGAGGQVTVTGGAGGSTSGAGGAVVATGGAGTNGNGAGGATSLTGGAGQGSGNGGASSLVGGLAGATGTGGAVSVTGGAGGSTSGAGGAVTIAGGAGTLNANGGALTINAGAKNGSGTDGTLTIGSTASALAVGNSGAILTYSSKRAAGASTNGITDPGNAGAIAVTADGVCNLTSAGAETRTLAVPTFIGQMITLCMDTDGGDIVVTVASAFNQATNTTITLNDAGDSITLRGCTIAGSRRWRIINNDGCTLG